MHYNLIKIIFQSLRNNMRAFMVNNFEFPIDCTKGHYHLLWPPYKKTQNT